MWRATWTRTVCLLALTGAIGIASSPAAAAGANADHAVRGFARATLAFAEERADADAEAQRNAGARRWAGGMCLDVWRAAPMTLREQLLNVYFVSVSGGLWQTDAPLFERWGRRLRAIRGVSRIASLRTARAVMKADVAAADRIYRAVPDACGPATAWMAAGWSADRRPAAFGRLARAYLGPPREFALERRRLQQAGALLRRRAGRDGRLAARVLADGVDEPDERVIRRCDTVVAVLDPPRAACPAR